MTHLQPLLRLDGAAEGDMINLEGEFDFAAYRTGVEVYESLRERAEIIGGLVTKEGDGVIGVYPWNGPGSFRLHFPADDETVERIDVVDQDGDLEEIWTIEELRERAENAEPVLEAMEKHMSKVEEDEEPEHGETYRIDFGEGELVPTDEDDA